MALDDQQLFLRFRRDGDVQALGELFDRAAPALLRLALHLCRDPAAAEDLLQSTFLRAIEVRDEWDGARPVLPWLCGILQNRARHDRWQQGRVPDPARLPATPPVDPARAAERSEFDAAVDAAIAELPEVYRPVLRLHLAYSHQPAEIAHALERPPGTVRSQLARGLELLRKLLPAGFAGGAVLLLGSGRGLAAVKQAVLGHASIAGPVAVVGTVIGGVVLMKKLVAVVAVAVFAAGAWLVWPRQEMAAPPDAAPGPEARPAHAATAAANPAEAAAPGAANERIAVSAPATTGALRIHCRFGEDDSPAWGVLVSVTPAGRDSGMQQRTVRSGDDGSVLVVDLAAGNTDLAADRGGSLQVEVAAGATKDVELVIPKGIDVRGQVVDETGAPVPAANVWLSDGPHDYCDGLFAVTSDQVGQFFLRSVEPERFLSATIAGRRSAAVQPVRGATGSTVPVQLVLRGEGQSLVGKVLDQGGAPAADARVFVGWRENPLRWNKEMFSEHRPPLELRTAPDGTFAVHGLQPGSKQAVWVRAVGCCVWYQVVELAAGGDTALAVQLQTGAALAGRATGADGKPIAGAFVMYRSTAWYPARGGLEDFRGPGWAAYNAETDADGRYRIDCITPGTLRLLARKHQLEVRGEVQVAAGDIATWDPVLVEIMIRGRVVDERSEPLAGVDVTGIPPRGTGNMASATTGADGRFVCRTLAPVPHVLTFFAAADKVRARPAATLFGIEPGGDEVLVRLPDAMIPTAVITGRLHDTDGQAPQQAQVHCSQEGLRWEPSAKVDASTGAFRIGPLPPGVWRLQGTVGEGSENRRSAWSEPFALAAKETHDVGALQMPTPGSVQVTVIGPDGAPLDKLSVVLEDSTGWSENPWLAGRLDRGRLRIDNVAPGSYRVRVGGERELPTVYQPVTVTAAAQATVDVAVPKGVGVELVLSPVSEPVPMHEHFVWTRDGALFQRYDNWWEGNGERIWRQRMLPGSYEVTITSETGKQTITRFVIGENDADGRRIAIALP